MTTTFRPDHKMTFQELAELYQRIRFAYRVQVKLPLQPRYADFGSQSAEHLYVSRALRAFANAFRDFDNAVNVGGPIAPARREAQWHGAEVQSLITRGEVRLEFAPPPPNLWPAARGPQQ